MKVAFHTLGCKVNQYETEAMSGQFRKAGFEVVPEDEKADCYVINSCTVTNIADRKTRQFIRRAKGTNPDALVCVAGCYSQVEPDIVWNMPEVDIVIGTGNKNDLIGMVLEALETGERKREVLPYEELRDYRDRGIITSMEGRVRAFIKIEEGCDRFCAYCLIPFARGRVRSRDPQEILEEARTLVAKGFREIVLTGINTALYGTEAGFKEKFGLKDTDETGIEIIIRMLDELPGDFRIRLSSLEPTVVDKDYVKRLMKYGKLTPHLHLSIQSGSDRILKAMGRRYTREEYLEIVRVLREHDEGYGVTTDIIVGFPGETGEDFEDSLRTCRKAEFLKVHAFKYSRRKGTRAYEMKDQVPGPVKNERIDRLISESDAVRDSFLAKEKGKKRTLLAEEVENGWLTGYTENYVRTYVKCPEGTDPESLIGQFITVVMEDLFEDGMTAEPEI
ncbi:MAG: tRNA (N(6)-L-threonylcarbamoyladenosine(37)-C(2))-methylthiotransferase MtaB [Firmicutes bacterium]|nr:tRNA (N(6)-L-threonylcarbamoyladenosine(37)-C(2))-methylthiotransferase MtaB [Bacillota bacterium]